MAGGAGGAVGVAHLPCNELEAANTDMGAAQRLVNLGYLQTVSTSSEYHVALKAFQAEHGLNADGKIGPGSATKLVEANGC